MNIKSIFEPIDRVIVQAKSYIHEQDVKKANMSKVESKVETIQPEIENRKRELLDLIEKIEPDDDFRTQLNEHVSKLEDYLDHVHLLAEKELALEILQQEEKNDDEDKKEMREKYVKLQVARLKEQLENTNNFFEVADFANEIWADLDLFEEFSRDEVVVQMLVDRMNETNAKNTETRIGRDLRKTLEHIRLNLVKSSAWSDEDIKEYQGERDLKLKQLQPVKIPDNRAFNVTILGGGPEILEKLQEIFALPTRLKLEWGDIDEPETKENLIRSSPKKDLVIFNSMFPKHQKFLDIKDALNETAIRYADVTSFETSKLMKVLEEELIQISFQTQFGGK